MEEVNGKVKDLSKTHPGISMGRVKVKTSSGEVGWWVSQWNKGVWLRPIEGQGNLNPVFVQDLKEVLEWEVLEIKNE